MLVVPHATQATRADGTPVELSVEKNDGLYAVTARFPVQGSTDTAIAVLTDYERIPAFMPGVKTSVVRVRSAERVVLEQDAIARFLVFSRRVHLVLDVRQEGNTIRFRDLAGGSFTRYEGSWRVFSDDGQTLVAYELSAAPAFPVPESILRRLLKRDSALMVTQLRREIERRSIEPGRRSTAPDCSQPSSSPTTSR
jgi:hypothetical protein